MIVARKIVIVTFLSALCVGFAIPGFTAEAQQAKPCYTARNKPAVREMFSLKSIQMV